ncbi:MAG: hypothetical protein ACP5RX_01515 [Minisyncoccia bacterium]
MTFASLKSILNDWEKKRKLLEKPLKKENLSSPFSKKLKKKPLLKNK